jgi:DNA-binding response OmpR family regulator
MEPHWLESPSLIECMDESLVPQCVLATPSGIPELNRSLRQRAESSSTPLVALVERLSGQQILDLYALGADDVVASHDLGGLTRRLSALSSFDPKARTALTKGNCLLALPDPYRRQLLGRVLRQAGFDVSFAADAREAQRIAEEQPPKVVVAAEDLPPEGGGAALRALAKDWLGTMPAVFLASVEASEPRESGWPVVRADAPPDDLLFVLNELLAPRELVESRASRRLLCTTPCTFRAAGDLEPRLGITYNISREGLYVRTFDAPARGPVWLELRPPRSATACHLRGEVVWIRALATGAHGAAPPGFGVRLSLEESPPLDFALYEKAYEALLDAVPEYGRYG